MAHGPRPRVTITQVAESAGVSRATVSRVMNGRSTVAADIAERVREAAARLNYRPSDVARSLSLGRTQMVSLVVPDLGNPMFQQILRGTAQAAGADGYRVLVAETGEVADTESDLALEARLRCDALVLVSPRSSDTTLTALLPQVQPVVLVNRELPGSDVQSIVVDYADAIGRLAEHLIGLGHRRIAYLAGPPTSATHAARVRGLAAVERAHAGVEVVQLDCGSVLEDGYASAEAVIASRVTGVLAFNDLVALGLMARLKELDVPVPERLSVAGMDDIDLARFSVPSLTTAHVPQFALGEHAWRQLRATINQTETAPVPPTVPELVTRDSTGPAPA